MSTYRSGPREPLYNWAVVLLLALCYVISFLDRQILALMIEPIKRDLQLSDTQISLLAGFAFALVHVALLVPLGRLADSGNRRNIIVIGLISWSLFTAACGAARNFLILLICRMGVGAGEATLVPASYSLIPDYFSRRNLHKAMALFVIGAPLGSGLALVVGGELIMMVERSIMPHIPPSYDFKPWQVVFFLIGAIGIPIACLLLLIREPARKDILLQKNDAASPSFRQALRFVESKKLYFLPMIIGLSLLNLTYYASLTWLPTLFIRHHEWSADTVGFELGIAVLLAGVAGPFGSMAIVRFFQSRGHQDACLRAFIASTVLAIICTSLTPIVADPDVALLLAAPLVFAMFYSAALVPPLIQLVTPNQYRAQISGLCMMIFNMVGLGLGPTAVALITDYGFGRDDALHLSMALVCFIASSIGLIAMLVALRPFRAALEDAKAWSDEDAAPVVPVVTPENMGIQTPERVRADHVRTIRD